MIGTTVDNNPSVDKGLVWMKRLHTRLTEHHLKKVSVFEEPGISREDALRMYTINNAYASFEEKQKGSIEAGKFADLVVLSADLLTCAKDSIRLIKPILTMVDGKIVYDAKELNTGAQKE